jgi:hypothetical protein
MTETVRPPFTPYQWAAASGEIIEPLIHIVEESHLRGVMK